MNRLVVMTVGKTHSGKTTFALALEKDMLNSIVIDQDNHAVFLHTYYEKLIPQQGHNTIKYLLTQTIVNHAINDTDCHIILSNSNRNRTGRLKLLKPYKDKNFTSVIVNFDIPEYVLQERVTKSQRSTSILRTVTTFEEVLTRQQNEEALAPTLDEVDHLFIVKNANEIPSVIREIIKIAHS
nr:AAA family ATPase [Bacillus sp. FJAT-22090]